jgi:hypothetical protein
MRLLLLAFLHSIAFLRVSKVLKEKLAKMVVMDAMVKMEKLVTKAVLDLLDLQALVVKMDRMVVMDKLDFPVLLDVLDLWAHVDCKERKVSVVM